MSRQMQFAIVVAALVAVAALAGCSGPNSGEYSCQSDQWYITGDMNTHPPATDAAGYQHC